MFCKKCGNLLNDGAVVCPSCGTAVEQINSQPAQPQVSQAAPLSEQPLSPAYSMKWYKFLIYFALFAGALLNLISGLQFLTGLMYGDSASAVYLFLPSLHTVDVLVGILSLAMVVLALFTRFRLSGYRKNGPALVLAVYAGSALINLIYAIAVPAIVGDLVEINVTSQISSIIVSIVMIVVNKIYFDKRKALFVN